MATCTLSSGTWASSGGNSGYQLAQGATALTTSGSWSATPGYPYKVTSVSVPWFGYTTGGTLSISGTVTITIKSGSTTIGSLSGSVSSTIYSNTNITGSVSCTGTVNCTSGTSYTLIVSCSGGSLLKSGVRFTTNGKSLTVNYSAQTYTVSYNANGHGTAPAAQTKTAGTTLTLQPYIATNYSSESTVTITGDKNGSTWSGSNGSAKWRYTYTQGGWNTNSAGTGTNYGSKGSYTANAAATLYAKWSSSAGGTSYNLPSGTPTKAAETSSSLTVTFNANGGVTTKTSQTSVKTTTYSFKGWFTSGGTQRTTSSRVTAAETVYAQFNSSTSGQGAVTCPTTTQCTRSGYTLLGWSTSSTATSANVSAGGSYTPSGNVTLYAVWGDPVKYRLSLNTQGGDYKIIPSIDASDISQNILENWKKFRIEENDFLAHYHDGYFKDSENNVLAYNWCRTGYTGTSSVSRVSRTNDNPFTNTDYQMRVTVQKSAAEWSDWNTGTDNCHVGFYQNVVSAASQVYLHLFVAKLPIGDRFAWAMNATGDNRQVEWLTDRWGTGEFKVYAYKLTCGSTGTFSSFSHVYVQSDKTTQMSFDLAFAEVYGLTSMLVPYDTLISNLPIPLKSGYRVKTWYTNYTGRGKKDYGRARMFTDKISIHLQAYMSNWAEYATGNDANQHYQMRAISCTEGGGWNIESANGYIRFQVWDAGAESYVGPTANVKFEDLESGWHTFDMTFDGTNWRGYVDGELIATSQDFVGNIGYHPTNGIFVAAEAEGDQTTANYYRFVGWIGNVIILNDDNLIPTDENRMMIMPSADTTITVYWERANHIHVAMFDKNITDLTGTTWYFNEVIDISNDFYYNINFTSYNINFRDISVGPHERDGVIYTKLHYWITNSVNAYLVYNENGDDTWNGNFWRTITITNGNDIKNADLIQWLQQNATLIQKQAKWYDVPIYVYYNNEWQPAMIKIPTKTGINLTNTTWYFKDTINIDISPLSFNINFTSNNKEYIKLQSNQSSQGDYKILFYYLASSPSTGQSTYNRNNINGWPEGVWRTIAITGGTDASSESCLQWLQANATLISGNPYIYEWQQP